MTFFQQASPSKMFSAGLLTYRPDANAFPVLTVNAFLLNNQMQVAILFVPDNKGGSQLRDSRGLSPHSLLIASS